MKIVKTENFVLATISAGLKSSARLALVLPGLLDTKDYAHIRSHIEFLATKGFFAVSFDPPGTWDSPGDISLYTPSNYLKAVNELIEYFGSKPTFVVGHSRGATMSIAAGTTNPNVFAFAAVMPSHVRGDYMNDKDNEWLTKGHRNELRDLPPGDGKKVKPFELPYSFFEDQIIFNFTDELEASHKPKLFIYGKDDKTATAERVKNIYALAGEPKQIVGINSGHSYRYSAAAINKINDIIGDFLEGLNT